MQSWIHVIEWRATVHPEVTALVDDRGARLTYAELRSALKERLSSFKCPKTVEFTGPLPRTTTGKVLKRELRSQLDGGY
jgi:acyl-CoA synthetase (AMP-forming)/AMP-acid ligase II